MLVSVIIPCYNVESYVSECIDSVVLQTYSELEIICVDNNSKDGTLNKLFECQKKYGEKIIVLTENKPGASCARNKGLSIARGQWIQFLDADDLLLPNKIQHQIELAIENKEAPFIVGACFKETFQAKRTTINLNYTDFFKALFITKLGNTCSNFFNAEKVKLIGGWNESIKSSQETDLMFRMLMSDCKPVLDNNPLTIIREREFGQISQGNPIENWKQYITVRLQIIDYLKTFKTDYFLKEKEFYYQNLFSQIRTLAKFDLKTASDFFDLNFQKDFVPVSVTGYSVYSILFKLFGFKKAEKIKKWIK